MRTVISQSILLPASAESLFAAYLDPVQHAAITGAPVTIGAAPGSPFRAFDGSLSGTMLHVIPSRLVIQSWRSTEFYDGDPDSTLWEFRGIQRRHCYTALCHWVGAKSAPPTAPRSPASFALSIAG